MRAGYDRALSECCAALGLTHLLGVIPAGPELDAERERVEETADRLRGAAPPRCYGQARR